MSPADQTEGVMPASSRPAWDRWLADALLHQASVDDGSGPTADRRDANARFASICRMVAEEVLARGTDAFDWPPTPAQAEIDAAVAHAKKTADQSWSRKLAEVEAERDRLDAYTFLIHIYRRIEALTDQVEALNGHVKALSGKVSELQARESTSEQQRLKDEFDARHGG